MNKLKIDEKIDLEWLRKYLFYSDTLYINPCTRGINIEGRNLVVKK